MKLIILLLLTSCKSNKENDPELERILNLAGQNRNQLEDVLNHYSSKEDSLKYQAAVFLIKGMSGRYAKVFHDYQRFVPAFDTLENINAKAQVSDEKDVLFLYKRDRVKLAINSYYIIDEEPIIKNDLETITKDFLIENIDYAFKAWELPWSRHLSFDEFCQFVLPYRYAHEELQNWRSVLYPEILKLINDNLKGVDEKNPVAISKLINKLLQNKYSRIPDLKYIADCLKPLDLVRSMATGSCVSQSGLALIIYRTIGLPVAHLYIPHWGNRNSSHDFNAVLGKDGKWNDFLFCEGDFYKTEFRFKPAKIYLEHYQYKRQNNIELTDSGFYKSPNPYFEDITKDIVKAKDIKLNYPKSSDFETVYLCIFDNTKWVPVSFAKIVNHNAEFKDVAAQIIYLPVKYNGYSEPVGSPFYLDHLGIVHEINKEEKLEKVLLSRKYFLAPDFEKSANKIKGAIIQAANNADFINYTTLFKIENIAYHPVVKKISPVKFQYLRILYPKSDQLNTALAGFKVCTSHHDFLSEIKDKIISNGVIPEKAEKNIFDNDPLTYLKILKNSTGLKFYKETVALNNTDEPFWIGYKFSKLKNITAIEYTLRNDDNAVYKGQTFELFYWDNCWVSLGKKMAINDTIEFKAPRNALLLMKNTKGGTENRIFLYQKDKQVWF